MQSNSIAGNKWINETIGRCFGHICSADASRFRKRFRDETSDQPRMHIFRELLVGAFLVSNDLNARYERVIDGKTPDWTILGEDGTPQCIVELSNFHTDRATEDEIARHRDARRVWSGRTPVSTGVRLFQRVQDKAVAYRSLVEGTAIGYVIAVFGEFTALIDLDDVRECLCSDGVLVQYPHVAGLLYFEENCGRYAFTYLVNSGATLPVALPSGHF